MTIKQKQCLLAYLGYYGGPVNDIWTDECKDATTRFQKDFGGIAVDGIVGPETEKALKHAVAFGMPEKEEVVSKNATTTPSTGTFQRRTAKPEAGNKYYITKANGGYSNAVQGKPTDPGCDVLANCVGYAYGRFNEIGGYGYCKYLSPVNAEKFIQHAGGLEVGQTPKLGACMVWKKGTTLSGDDGAGHVAIVEQVISPTQVVTSESGYNSKAFWTQTRSKGSGNWGMSSDYTFLGFIYNPAVSDDATTTGAVGGTAFNTSVPAEPLKYSVGDIVEFIGSLHFANACALTGLACTPGKVKITGVYENGYHQYHVVGISGGSTAYGWVDADDLKAL